MCNERHFIADIRNQMLFPTIIRETSENALESIATKEQQKPQVTSGTCASALEYAFLNESSIETRGDLVPCIDMLLST